MKRSLLSLFTTLCAAIACAQVPFELTADRAPKVHTGGNCLIKNATVLTVTKGDFEGTDILIRDGKIVQIGKGLTAPAGFTVIDATGKVVVPGIIDAHSHRGIDGTNEGSDSIVPEVRMADVINTTAMAWWQALASGHTTGMLLHGSANPVGGESIVVKYKYGRPTSEAPVSDAPRMVKFALGENVTRMSGSNTTRFPATRMGVEATYRRAFEEARDYRRRQNAGEDVRKDLRLETLADLLDGKVWVQCHSYRSDEILMLVRLSQEYGFKIGAMQHALEAYKIAPELAKANVGVSVFADDWGYKVEAYDAIPFNAYICWKAGVTVSINTDGLSGTTALNIDAAKAMRYGGVPSNEVLKMLTINPAKELGIEKRTGSLEVGKDADIGIWDGHPLSVYSRPYMTMIEGEVYFQRHDAFGVDSRSTIKTKLDETPYKGEPALPKESNVYAVRNATIHTVTAGTIENGTIVVENGKITAIGRRVTIPSGASVIEGKGMHVYPGFIECGASIGLSEISGIAQMDTARELGTMEPDMDAATALYMESAYMGTSAYCGVTMSLTKPGGGTIPGQAALIRHFGYTTEQLALLRKAALVVSFPSTAYYPELEALLEAMCDDGDAGSWAALGMYWLDNELPPPNVYRAQLVAQQQQQGQGQGQGRRGVGGPIDPAQVSQRIKDLEDYIAKAREYGSTKHEKRDLTMEAMQPYVNGERPMLLQARTAATIRSAVDFAKRNKVKVILTAAAEAWKEADLLAREKIPVVLPAPGLSTLSANGTTTAWDPYDEVYASAQVLAKAGVKFGFETGNNAMVMNLPMRVGECCAYGLSVDDAVKALTLWPAEMFGVSDRVGSLEVGKDAEFFVCGGDPFEPSSHVQVLFIGGKPVPMADRFTQFRDKYLARLK